MSRRLQTVAAVACMKLMLTIFNLIFWVAGIILLAFGLWMKISLHSLLELSDDYNDAVPYIFIGTGAAIVIVGLFACCCTFKGQPYLLYLLAVFLSIIFVLEVAAGIAAYSYRGKIADGFKTGLDRSISHYGQGGIYDRDIDMLQSYLKCCGVNNYTDWNEKWQNNSVPLSCCKDKANCQNAFVDPLNPTDIYTSGCYVNVVDFVDHNLGAICGGAVALACFQLLGVILACCLAKYIGKAKYEPVD